MSSTTDDGRSRLFGRRSRRSSAPRGQVLVIFAFGVIGILAVAALVFDVGQNLFERRKQQDAADASALAGARWMAMPACKVRTSAATCPEAYNAALNLALTHSYAVGQVSIHIPPTSGQFTGMPGHLQVAIDSNRGSYFAGVVGITSFNIGASAVAANIVNYPLPFSLLALNSSPSTCKTGHAHGNGTLTIQGDVMVNSPCTNPGALVADGVGATINVSGNCSAVGTIQGNTGVLNCGARQEGAPAISDPLAGFAPPVIGSAAVPKPPADMVVTGAHAGTNRAPSGCPGSTSPSTAASPSGCTIAFANRDKVVWIHPGVYYGGLKISQTSGALTVYMAPGVYYMAGGGFQVSGQATVRTVDAANGLIPFPTLLGGGVLIYNTDCVGCGGSSGIQAIDFQNTTNVQLLGYTGANFTGMLLWQDRKASAQPAVSIEGSSTMKLKGTIYIPKADFKFTGNGGSEVLDAQVVCDEFDIGGNGNVLISYDPNDAIKISGVGLVQ